MARNEAALQISCVNAYRYIYPRFKFNLWSTRNTTFSAVDGANQQKMGMLAGVSDLMMYKNGVLICIELKLPESRHKAEHIKQQLEFGKTQKAEGGEYFIVTNAEAFLQVIDEVPDSFSYSLIKGVYNIPDIEDLLKQESKTIKFY